MVKKSVFNYHNDLDYKRDGIEGLEAAISDSSKVIANPEGVESSKLLNVLQVGDVSYLVNEKEPIRRIKALRIVGKTMQGNDNNIVLKQPIKLSNQYTGEIYSYTSSDTIITDATGARGLENLVTNGSQSECYLPASALPITIDITFGDTVDISEYNIISIGCGPYSNASFKAVDIYISTNGVDYVKVVENPDIGFTASAYREVGAMYSTVKPDSIVVTITDDDVNPITCDYSFADIKNMIENGINIVFKIVDPEDSSLVGYTRCVSIYSFIYVELFAGYTTTEYTIKPSAITRTDYSRTSV